MQELCNWETFSAQCPDNQVIMMMSAFYGRMKIGRCIRETFDNKGNRDPIGCSENIIRYFLHFLHQEQNGTVKIELDEAGKNSRIQSTCCAQQRQGCQKGRFWSFCNTP